MTISAISRPNNAQNLSDALDKLDRISSVSAQSKAISEVLSTCHERIPDDSKAYLAATLCRLLSEIESHSENVYSLVEF